MFVLKVTYRVKAHQIGPFERIFTRRILPIVRRHGLRFKGIWKTVVGDVGEFLELWEFESLSEFQQQWPQLLQDPELLEVFNETGPMVENENFALLEPVQLRSAPSDSDRFKV